MQSEIDALKAQITIVDAEIERRFAENLQAAYQRAKKQYGTLHIDAGDGLTATGTITKKVEWDSPALLAVAKEMSWADVQHFFDIKVSMKERTFDAIAPSDPLKAKVAEARTVKYGALKIELDRKEA